MGPFFIDGNLTGQRYLQLLQEQVIPTCAGLFPDENNLDIPTRNLCYQQDGVPPHYEINVRRYLDAIFSNRWISRRGAVEWLASNPDLTPLDFFLWGHLKTKVYRSQPETVEDLQ